MRVIGFNFGKGQLRFSVLEGTFQNPRQIQYDRRLHNSDLPTSEKMDWYRKNFLELIDQFNPDQLSYRFGSNGTNDQMRNLIFPCSVLQLTAFDKQIVTKEWTSRLLNPSRFGHPPNTDLYTLCDTQFGNLTPYWDKSQKAATLCAWLSLKV